MKVLVVEPSATLRRAVKNALRACRVDEVVEVADGSQALALGDASIDLVITEWAVSGVSGIELIKCLRENPETSGAAVLMLTTRNRRSDVLEALEAGVNGYLLKPFTAESLKHAIDLVIAGRDEQRQAA